MQPGETIPPNQGVPDGSNSSDSVPSPQPSPAAPETAFKFNPEKSPSNTVNTGNGSQEAVEWTASEFIAHHKQASWFLGLIGATVVLTAVVYFITDDMISTVMVIVVGGLFGFIANRKPKAVRYMIDSGGVSIGQQRYAYNTFKSFSVEQEGVVRSIRLLPLKRFMPAIFMYYAPEDETKIIQHLAAELPFEKHEPDLVDKVMHRVRF